MKIGSVNFVKKTDLNKNKSKKLKQYQKKY